MTSLVRQPKRRGSRVDGLIWFAPAGAMPHISPFALVGEIRRFYDGPIALSRGLSNGSAILGHRPWGRILPTSARVSSHAGTMPLKPTQPSSIHRGDVVYTPYFTVSMHYLKKSIVAAGLVGQPAVKDKAR